MVPDWNFYVFNTNSAELIRSECFRLEKKAKYCYFEIVLTIACGNLADSANQDQTACSVQSDLDLHFQQKQLCSSIVRFMSPFYRI